MCGGSGKQFSVVLGFVNLRSRPTSVSQIKRFLGGQKPINITFRDCPGNGLGVKVVDALTVS